MFCILSFALSTAYIVFHNREMGQNGIVKHNFCNFFKYNLVSKNIFLILLSNENQ